LRPPLSFSEKEETAGLILGSHLGTHTGNSPTLATLPHRQLFHTATPSLTAFELIKFTITHVAIHTRRVLAVSHPNQAPLFVSGELEWQKVEVTDRCSALRLPKMTILKNPHDVVAAEIQLQLKG